MPSSLACADIPARLRALERAAGDGASAAGAQEMRRHLQACAPCQHTHGARLTTLEGLCALRSRQVPGKLLEDLRSRVLTQVRRPAADGVHAGGMSATFLDAPVSLARWRRVALAASVLLAVGVGLVVSGRLSLAPERGVQDRELRDALLPRLDARQGFAAGAGNSDDVLQPVLLPGRGMRGYFVGRPALPRDGVARERPVPAQGSPSLQPPLRGVEPQAASPAVPDPLAPETGD